MIEVLSQRIDELEQVLKLCKPIVGAAAAIGDNRTRELRTKVYQRIESVLKNENPISES